MRTLWAIGLLLTTALPATADEVEGFTEPYREVALAAADTGLLDKIYVREGQGVAEGELVATLDTQVLEASRRIAEQHTESKGKLSSARADLKLRQARVDKFDVLLQRNHATQEEVDRAAIERDIAAATVMMAEEEIAIRRLERDRIAVQLQRRSVRSPIAGVVVQRQKEVGEFVSPADPIVMTVVQLDPLRATFNLPEAIADSIAEGEQARVTMLRGGEEVAARVEFVSPVLDSESGTVRVRVRIPNPDLALRAGERCTLRVDQTQRVAERP